MKIINEIVAEANKVEKSEKFTISMKNSENEKLKKICKLTNINNRSQVIRALIGMYYNEITKGATKL